MFIECWNERNEISEKDTHPDKKINLEMTFDLYLAD